jgi:hypothetical protein
MLRFRLPGAQTARHFLIEFLIVVAGILAALGVDQWRNDRQEVRIAEEHLADVTEEVRQNLCTIHRVTMLATARKFANLQTVINFLNDPAAPVEEPAALLEAFATSTLRSRPWIVDNQYQALQNSGNVRLVRRLLPDMPLSGLYEAPSVLYYQVDRLQGDYPVVVNELIPAQLQQRTNILANYARGAHAPALTDDPDLDRAIDAIRARRVELLALARNEAAVATASWLVLWRMRSDHEEVLARLAPWDRSAQPVAEMLEECGQP